MFETCEMKLEPLASAKSGPLEFQIVASKTLCVDPSESFAPWPYAARLIVHNTGSTALNISHGDGAIGQNAFGMSHITEFTSQHAPQRTQAPDRRGPIDPNEAKTTTLQLAPNARHEITGAPTYILVPMQAAVNGASVNGAPIADIDRWVRKFELEFNIWLKVGDRDVTTTMTAPLTVMIKPPEQ